MNELTRNWLAATQKAIRSLQRKYSDCRGLLLTEGDLECHLFHELLNQPGLSGYHHSKNDTFYLDETHNLDLKTTYVHSQITWFKPRKKSGFEVDITICDPAKLEVINIELFEEYTSKGFAYDGECVAIEIKCIRRAGDAKSKCTEDYIHLRDHLIPAKLQNIINGRYEISSPDNIAFVTVVGCKNKEAFDNAKPYLGKQLVEGAVCPENLFICLFYQDEIIWDKEVFKQSYYELANTRR